MANLSQLASLSNSANSLANLILVTPQSQSGYQPQNAAGSVDPTASPILFHYEGENTIAVQSDITDNFVEDNTAIQDQIALRPEMVTVHGFIGELNDVVPLPLVPLKVAAEKLTLVSEYLPALSATALLAYNDAVTTYKNAERVKNAAVAAWSSLTGTDNRVLNADLSSQLKQPNQTKQQIIFGQFYGYWRARRLFTIQTPWAIMDNMAIMTLRAIQAEDTRMITDFEVTFKKIRFAQTITTFSVSLSTVGYFGNTRGAAQSSSAVNVGPTTPQPANRAFSPTMVA